MSLYSKIAIIGRPNVGKSTLFNRILGERFAIVEPTKGVTRDRVYKEVEWDGLHFILIDTGGLLIKNDPDKGLYSKIKEQTLKAVEEADIIVLLTDVSEGLHPLDSDIASILRKAGKRVFVAVNKADTESRESDIAEFQKLGFEDVVAISALHGRSVDILLEGIKKHIKTTAKKEVLDNQIKIAIIGRPNAGKSSFLNAILKEERVVVDEDPGTTRDAVDIAFTFKGQDFLLIDTAGIRHRSKVKAGIDFFGAIRTKEAIDRSDVVLFLIDGFEGIKRDDLHYIYEIWRKKKGLVLGINKKDLIKIKIPDYDKLIKEKLNLAEYLFLIYLSAKDGYNVKETLLAAASVYKGMCQRIKTSELNSMLQKVQSTQASYPKVIKGRATLKIFYAAQTGILPPEINIIVSHSKLVNTSFVSFIERKIRSKFGFTGVPIRIIFKEKK